MKTCSKCEVSKDTDCFAKNARAKDGLQSYCKPCMSEVNKARNKAAKTKKRVAAYNKRYNAANHEHKLDLTQQWRVRQAGGEVREEVNRRTVWEAAGRKCQGADCGRPLRYEEMHLDHRVAVKKGGEHSYANAQCLCGPCNLKKGDRDV